MNAFSSPGLSGNSELGSAVERNDQVASDLVLGLQYCRANAMSLTRLQLALKTGDRKCALEAMDQLHALDAEMERLVKRLPPPSQSGTGWAAINKHLGEQKIAIAFEKLAFASGIQGPDLASRPAVFPREAEGEEDEYTFPDWPNLPEIEPEEPGGFPWRKAAIALLAILIVATVAFAVSFAATA